MLNFIFTMSKMNSSLKKGSSGEKKQHKFVILTKLYGLQKTLVLLDFCMCIRCTKYLAICFIPVIKNFKKYNN